jgi:hypothetical protein
MRLVCRSNRALDLSDHQIERGTSLQATYPLTVGSPYIILGMGIWERVLSFLVRNDIGRPSFVPAGLFEEQRVRIPTSWEFTLQAGIRANGRQLWTDPCIAVWGYHELVANPDHAGALEEGDEKAYKVFLEEYRAEEASGSTTLLEG